MSGLEIAFGIVLLVFAVGIIIFVLSQQGEQKNSGVITGGSSDTYIAKNSGRTIDAFLARWTKIFAVGFFLCVVAVNIVVFALGLGTSADASEDAGVSTDSAVITAEGDAASESEDADASADDSDAEGASSGEENADSSTEDDSTADSSAA